MNLNFRVVVFPPPLPTVIYFVYCVKSNSYLFDVELVVYEPLKLIVNSDFLGIFDAKKITIKSCYTTYI